MRILFIGAHWFLDELPNQNFPFKRGMQLAGSNTGNLFIGEATRFHLRRLLPDIEKIRYLTKGEIENEDYITAEWANTRFDCIVMAAANMINEAMELTIEADFIEKTNLPFMILGIGAQAADRTSTVNASSSIKKLLHIAAERSHAIGVRGEYTASVVESFGIKNIEVMGCPSMYMNINSDHKVTVPAARDIKQAAIFTKRDDLGYEAHKKLVQLQAKQVRHALDNGFNYIIQTNYAEAWLAFHGEVKDSHIKNISAAFRYKTDEIEAFTEKLMTHLRIFFHYRKWKDYLKGVDFTYGARFHGNMMSVMNNVPGVCVCHDSRTLELCEFMDLPHINIADYDPDDFSFEAIVDTADYSEFNKNYKAKCDRFDGFMRKQLAAFL
ncbi:polysaccharide pyruvyl transferase family protein [Kordiimonas sp. SCSIO 12610]|uniref:polysaccharide pyruvyl transferase family protein n=1 Tax=Kordiimonas sp. SCSIO 12610 TaxID=2829597 RepID=UPI00210BACC7|nr:polysaccharide pyruvyl transferase family protein [Kordiimonas sp. SCSIO 12610]UTW56143.1 polysaccharide pyruvyl transferase family protein [Kordiimonas sp. SCSIO 12610]